MRRGARQQPCEMGTNRFDRTHVGPPRVAPIVRTRTLARGELGHCRRGDWGYSGFHDDPATSCLGTTGSSLAGRLIDAPVVATDIVLSEQRVIGAFAARLLSVRDCQP